MTDDDESVVPDEEEIEPLDDEPIDEDLPCIRCSYNLRGLKPAGQCPECGARISATLRYVMQAVLCPVCLRPNHPTAAICAHCKSPTTGAAAQAAYWRPMATSGGRPNRANDDDEDEPETPSSTWMGMCWVVGLMVLVFLAVKFCELWWGDSVGTPSASDLVPRIFFGIIILLVALVPICIIIFPTSGYLRAKREYLAKRAAFLAKKQAAEKKTPGNPLSDMDSLRVLLMSNRFLFSSPGLRVSHASASPDAA